MVYPTIEQVEAADRTQLCRWSRFLPSPGMAEINKPGPYNSLKDARVQKAMNREVTIMNRIAERLKEAGGFIPEISKLLGWQE